MANKVKVEFRLPFEEEWVAFWAGDTKELNQHHGNTAQHHAIDFIIIGADGKFYKTDGKTNEDYYSFSKEILCPASGIVHEIVDGIRDNIPKDTNPYSIMGNYVMIRHDDGTYSVLSHLKQHSIAVKVGDEVVIGDLIGQCGNSGQSSDPHLHYHVQDSDVFASLDENYHKIDVAKGVKIHFSHIAVSHGKTHKVHNIYSLVKGDIVSNGT